MRLDVHHRSLGRRLSGAFDRLPYSASLNNALLCGALLVCALLCAASTATAADETEAAAQAGASENSPEVRTAAPPLEPLPEPPRPRLPEPKTEDLELLEQLLKRLSSSDGAARSVGYEELLEVDSSLLPAMQARIDLEAKGANRAAMKQLLLDTRREVRDELRQAMRSRGESGEVETPDYLPMLLSKPRPTSDDWKRLVHVLAISRMCVQLGSVEAVRVLIHVYVRFEFLRIDTQLQLKKLGDKGIAALIETTRHQAPSISSWAKRRLDFLGKAIPSEVVQVEDPEVLADVLRAYGRTRDPDAARLVISFANSERSQVRLASRQAVAMLGETGNWSLRDTYENMVGKKPPREWSWDRTARELFREFDKIRLAELYEHYERGLQALSEDDLSAMRVAFDKVVARDPDFTPRDELVKGYLRFAEANMKRPDFEVDVSLERAARLAQTEAQRSRATSLLLTRQAQRLADTKVADRTLLDRALELDPDNEHARELLALVSQEPFSERTTFVRLLWPATIGGSAVLFALIVAFFRLRRTSARPT